MVLIYLILEQLVLFNRAELRKPTITPSTLAEHSGIPQKHTSPLHIIPPPEDKDIHSDKCLLNHVITLDCMT